uniref:Aquaporin n=1 Tax=Aegilops tauschii subsp. strangulata TaxID=200361 RepID=A0A453R7D5_AEGTS
DFVGMRLKCSIDLLQWIFWVGPFTGAALAAFYHKIVLRDEAVVKESLEKLGSLKRSGSTA